MPVHDWTRVDSGTAHSFHCCWITHLHEVLNGGLLPSDFYALAEQHAGWKIADILRLPEPRQTPPCSDLAGAIAVTVAPPRVRKRLLPSPEATYRRERRSIAVRHTTGHRLIALVEIASTSNKDRPNSVEEFADKILSALDSGVHVLLIDLIPPGRHDPIGLHGVIWSSFSDEEEPIDPAAPLTFASYVAPAPRRMPEAYVETLGLGSLLPEMPLFLEPGAYVNVPLEDTYLPAYRGMPAYWQDVIEGRREVERA